MRPEREDIAAPDLPAGIEWVGEPPASMPALTAAGPVLVHFFDYAQLNSVRTLPYLVEWERRYRDAGLRTIGVQAPRFPFGAERATVAAGLARLGAGFPVAIDAGRRLWHAYGCEGWPSLFLWKAGGALSWFHFGEGEYLGTEEAIQAELRERAGALGGRDATSAPTAEPGSGPAPGRDLAHGHAASPELPPPMAPLRPSDAPDARVMPPSGELFPGGSWERPWAAGEDGAELTFDYAAGGAYATVEGTGELAVQLDGGSAGPQGGSAEPQGGSAGPVPVDGDGAQRPTGGSRDGLVEVDGAALYPLAEHPRHESHRLTLRPSPGLRIWSVSFAAGVP